MEKINWFVQFFRRIGAETPSFFRKIIYFGITLGTIGIGLIALKSQLPLWIVDLADNLVIIGLVSGIVAKSAVKNPKDIQK